MSKRFILVLKEQPHGRDATPWLEPYREQFKNVAKACALELDKNLKGGDKVRAMNHCIAEGMKKREDTTPPPSSPPPVLVE